MHTDVNITPSLIYFSLELVVVSYDSVMHTAPEDHLVQVWSQSSHLPVRKSDFRSITKVPISREL